MSCCCCTSTRGASFFCTSIHVFTGLYLSIKWIVVTYMKGGFEEDYFEDHRMRVLFPLLLVYLSIFLVLGCINFIAVERESTSILKWSMKAFLFLQISMLLTNTLLAFAFPEMDSDLELHRFYHVKFMVINVVATSIYFYVIWRFVFSLENGIYEVHKKRRKNKCPSAPRTNLGGPLDPRASPSAPWSDSPTTSRSLQEQLQAEQRRRELEEEDELSLPLKSNSTPEPQPCSSKSRKYFVF